MKNNQLSFLLLSVVLLVAQMALAQTQVRSFPGMTGKPTLVREWKNGMSLVWMYDVDGPSRFVLEDASSTVYKTVEIPGTANVTDLIVVGDTAYFCGSMIDSNQTYAFLGCFDISPMQTSCVVYSLLEWHVPKLTVVRKIAYFNYDGLSHLAFIGEYNPANAPTLSYCILGDAYFNGLWTGSSRQVSSSAWYTDITATDGYVVAVADDTQSGHRCYVRVFEQSGNIFTTELTPGNMFEVTGGTWLDNPQVERLDGDRFVVANKSVLGQDQGVSLKMFTINQPQLTLTPYHALMMPLTLQPDFIMDLYHWSLHQELLVLLGYEEDAMTPHQDEICRLDLTNLGTGTASTLTYPGYRKHRLEKYDYGNGFQCGGRIFDNDHTPILLKETYGDPSECYIYGYHAFYEFSTDVQVISMTETPKVLPSSCFRDACPVNRILKVLCQ